MRTTAHAVAAVALGLALSACGDDPDSGPEPSTSSASPQDEATDAYRAYWDIYVQQANSGDINSAAFDGVADGAFLESVLGGLRAQADTGAVRVGSPAFGEYDTSIDGATAQSTVCVSFDGWQVRPEGGDPVDPPEQGATRFEATLEQRDDVWIVTDQGPVEGESCSVES